MKQLSDKELGKILNQKMSGLEPLESDHLWSGIESSLPVNSSGLIYTFAKIVLFLGGVTAIIIASLDSSDIEYKNESIAVKPAPYITPTENSLSLITTNYQPPLDEEWILPQEPVDVNKLKALSVESVNRRNEKNQVAKTPFEQTEQTPGQLATIERVYVELAGVSKETNQKDQIAKSPFKQMVETTQQPTVISKLPTLGSNEALVLEEDPTEIKEIQSQNLNFKLPEIQLFKVDGSIPTSYEESVDNQVGNWFWGASTYLSFHSLDPSRLDENYLGSSRVSAPSISNRIGMKFQYGYSKTVSSRLSLNTSLSLDYYKTQFYFNVLNELDPTASLENNRLDVGLNFGGSYNIRSFFGNSALEAELGLRTKLAEFSGAGTLNYTNTIATYRLAYLVKINRLQVGPMYSSFISGKNYFGYGTIKPTIYGFMVRKNIWK